MHDSAENCIKFRAKVKTLARSHTNENVIKILKGEAVTETARAKAKADLYDVIIRQIADAQLIAQACVALLLQADQQQRVR